MAVPSPSPPAKDDLRRDALARRRAFSAGLDADARRRLEGALAQAVLPHLATARTIAFYHPLASEIGPAAIMDGLAPGRRAVFPWFAARDSVMLFRAGPALEPGPWGMLQPDADAPAHDPDLLLVPLVLADRAGARIGHGQGHYDRALARLRAAGPVTAIGLGWTCQLVDGPLPADPWDARLDAVATPEGWFPCR
jgi:5-formyltetrahydrofolate cyclo-ligase